MSRALILVLVACAGCRIGFGDFVGTGDDTAIDAGALPDIRPDVPFQTVTFGERVGSQNTGVTSDSYILEWDPAVNLGAASDLSAGGSIPDRERALMRFELSGVVPGTIVLAARLHLVVASQGDQVDGPLVAIPIAEPWTPGTVTWAEASTGVAWSEAGGSPASSGAVTFTPVAGVGVVELPAALVQSWLDVPIGNAGVVLTPADELLETHYHFEASRSSLVDSRPLLELEIAK